MQKICIFDNYDSFTFNLHDLFCKVRKRAVYHILRNTDRAVFDLDFQVLVISPGPMGPRQTGCLQELFLTRVIPERIPVFGVCLGMQFLAAHFGGTIIKSAHPVHGQTMTVVHSGNDIFTGIRENLEVMRYNSLEVLYLNAEVMEVMAREEGTGMIMAIRHRELPFAGVQFHPESFLARDSIKLIHNFFKQYVDH